MYSPEFKHSDLAKAQERLKREIYDIRIGDCVWIALRNCDKWDLEKGVFLLDAF